MKKNAIEPIVKYVSISQDDLSFGVFPNCELSLKCQVHMPKVTLPGITLYIKRRYKTKDGNIFPVIAYIDSPLLEPIVKFKSPTRGYYFSNSIWFCISDIFGFTYTYIKIPSFDCFYVYPELNNTVFTIIPKSGNISSTQMHKYKRSDELLDSRKYFPGDDTRKIHWKQYAHSENLFLRQSDFLPEPDSSYITIIDSHCFLNYDKEVYTKALNQCSSVCADFITQNHNSENNIFYVDEDGMFLNDNIYESYAKISKIGNALSVKKICSYIPSKSHVVLFTVYNTEFVSLALKHFQKNMIYCTIVYCRNFLRSEIKEKVSFLNDILYFKNHDDSIVSPSRLKNIEKYIYENSIIIENIEGVNYVTI